MPNVLIEEKGNYGIDCKNALWKTDEIHALYHRCGLPHLLCDADFVIETETNIILIEYKNANVPEARAHVSETEEYNPFEPKKFDKIVKKYYDSLHYLYMRKKAKPIHYVFVLEYPKGDSVSRKALRNRLKKHLPFKLQETAKAEVKLIEAVDVLNIAEWNNDEVFGRYPIKPCAEFST